MAHRFRAKVEIVGVVSRIRCKTFRLSHDSLDSLFIGKCKWCVLPLISDLFEMKEVDLIPLIV